MPKSINLKKVKGGWRVTVTKGGKVVKSVLKKTKKEAKLVVSKHSKIRTR